MNVSKRAMKGTVLLLCMVGAGLAIGFQGRDNKHQKSAYLTARVERGDIEDTVAALGTVQPLEFVDVGTQVTGQLKALRVRVGNEVRKGELIAEVDPTLFASRAGMTAASLKKVRAELEEKRVMLRLAQQEYDRNKGLFAIKAASEEVLEQSEAALDRVSAQIAALDAEAELYQAELKGDQANLRYTKIFAPMSGTVVALIAREGQTLVANQQAPIILRIADLNTMTVWAQVSEADVPRINVHEPVFFSPIGLPTKRWHTEVRQILPTPESVNAVILYDVLFDVSNKAQLLKPQMSVQASFVIGRAENALLVPAAALQPLPKHHKSQDKAEIKVATLKGGGDQSKKDKAHKGGDNNHPDDGPEDLEPAGKHKYLVRVLRESGEVEEREVMVGVRSRLQAEILSGLAEGDEVIVGSPDEGSAKGKPKTSGSTKS